MLLNNVRKVGELVFFPELLVSVCAAQPHCQTYIHCLVYAYIKLFRVRYRTYCVMI
jgi:hypothetical protein